MAAATQLKINILGSALRMDSLAPEDFDLDLHVDVSCDTNLLTQKTGVTDVCTTIFWPCAR